MPGLKLEKMLADLASATNQVELVKVMERIAGNLGFSAFNFMDIGRPDILDPYTVTTHDQKLIDEYRDNDFMSADPMLPIARRRNIPFRWSEILNNAPPLPKRSKSLLLMEAAGDHGFVDGLVIPIHFFNQFGFINSAACAFFWKSEMSKLTFMLHHEKYDLHILATYFTQYLSELAAHEMKIKSRFFNEEDGSPANAQLTSRERDVLSWAIRGKTADETADILNISRPTVVEYVQNAKKKLGAMNKTHAVSIALYHGLIDY